MADDFRDLLTGQFDGQGPDPEAEAEEPEAPEPETPGEEEVPDPDEIDEPPTDEVDEPEVDPEDEDDPDEQDEEPSDDTFTVTVDGEELEVGLEELQAGYQRQADYTKKTQELSAQRREVEQLAADMEQWYTQRAADPSNWVSEIVSEQQDPTTTLVMAMVGLAKEGKLDPEFVKTFGIDTGEFAQQADRAYVDQRVSQVEQTLQEREQQAAAQAQQQKALAEYRAQYAEIVSNDGLTFESPDQERAFKQELVEFAQANQITDLRVAHDALARRRERQAQSQQERAAQKQASEAVQKRKKASAAITPKGTAGSAPPPLDPSDFRAAAREALANGVPT